MKIRGLGVDAVEVARFRALKSAAAARFMHKTFSKQEREYCLSYKDSSVHFAGTFAAKEAVQKATGFLKLDPTEIEIVRAKTGKPEVWIKGKRSRSILVSITHEKTIACAVALYGL